MSRKTIDMSGERYGRLYVRGKSIRDDPKGSFWICQCDCGNLTEVARSSLTRGFTISCGCFRKEDRSRPRIKQRVDNKSRLLQNININETTGCWNWQGGLTGQGYGQSWDSSTQEPLDAHRLSYKTFVGPLPESDGSYHGICVLHKCDNPKCINPEHLFLGTQKINIQDCAAKGRKRGQRK